jgi:hypothetical protein
MRITSSDFHKINVRYILHYLSYTDYPNNYFIERRVKLAKVNKFKKNTK